MTRGLFIGRFEPLHSGHKLVIEFARKMVDTLWVMVCQDPTDIIPVQQRYQWLLDSYAHDFNVVPCTNYRVVDVTKEENPELFWHEWVRNCQEFGHFDYVFGGEEYCQELADRLGAEFLPVWRNGLNDMSATKFRNNPIDYWSELAPVCRPYFIKRIAFTGVESAGKTTMIQKVLNYFGDGTYVDEWAREYLQGRPCTFDDLTLIAKGQIALEEARALASTSHFMLCDTDPLMTYICSLTFFGKASPELYQMALTHNPYSATLVFDGSVPYVPDQQREADKINGSPIHADGRLTKVDDYIEAVNGEFKRKYFLVDRPRFKWRETRVIKYLSDILYPEGYYREDL